MKAPTSIAIKTEYITLGQFLKFAQIIDFGGLAKGFLPRSACSSFILSKAALVIETSPRS